MHPALLHTITHLHVCTYHMCDHRHSRTVTGGAYVFSWMQKHLPPLPFHFPSNSARVRQMTLCLAGYSDSPRPNMPSPRHTRPHTRSTSPPALHTQGSPPASPSSSLPQFPQVCLSLSLSEPSSLSFLSTISESVSVPLVLSLLSPSLSCSR